MSHSLLGRLLLAAIMIFVAFSACADLKQSRLFHLTNCDENSKPGALCYETDLIYVGLSPDDGTPIFTTRCDAGQYYDKKMKQCIGQRAYIPWNNGQTFFEDDKAFERNHGDPIDIPSTNCDWEKSPSSKACISGVKNTTTLAFSDSHSYRGMQPHRAAQYCFSMSRAVYSDTVSDNDWYLPSIAELNMLYKIKDTPHLKNSFDSNDYWSSSQSDQYDAWTMLFTDDIKKQKFKEPHIPDGNGNGKENPLSVRCFYKPEMW